MKAKICFIFLVFLAILVAGIAAINTYQFFGMHVHPSIPTVISFIALVILWILLLKRNKFREIFGVVPKSFPGYKNRFFIEQEVKEEMENIKRACDSEYTSIPLEYFKRESEKLRKFFGY